MSEAVIEAARELLGARNYSSVVAVASHAIDDDQDDTEMRILRARALLALRRDEEAQSDLRECLRRSTRCSIAYRLLGELCFRRDEYESAVVFLTEALRLEPDDDHSRDLLAVVTGFLQPTAVAEKLPAAAAVVGCSSSSEPREAQTRPPRLARGTHLPPLALIEEPPLFDSVDIGFDDLAAPTLQDAWPVEPTDSESVSFTDTEAMDSITRADPIGGMHERLYIGIDASLDLSDAPATVPERPRHRRADGSESEAASDGPRVPEKVLTAAETFGRFLIEMGALSPAQLHMALEYQRRRGCGLASAVISLGYASEPTVRTAGLAFRAERGIRRSG